MLSLIGLSAGALLSIWLKWDVHWGLLMGLLFSLLLCAARTHHYIKKIKKTYNSTFLVLWKKKSVRKLFISQFGMAMLCGMLQLAPLLVLLWMFSRASAIAEDDYLTFLAVAVQCALFIAIVGGIVLYVTFIPRYRKHWWVALFLVLMLPLLLTIISRTTGMLPMAMAQMTKVGNFRAEKLILSPKACGSIAPILGISCDEKTSPPIQLCNVHVMSRIGPETYLRIADKNAGKDGKYSIHRVFLPTAEIASMQLNFSVKHLRLDLVDNDLGGRSSACDSTLNTLRSDSAFAFNDFTLTDGGKARLMTF